jgi:hypothetical protein
MSVGASRWNAQQVNSLEAAVEYSKMNVYKLKFSKCGLISEPVD